jgi:HEAT repeat protein
MRRILVVAAALTAMAAAQPNVTAWEVLKKGLAETNPEKRKQAVLALASIGPAPQVIELLNEALRDKEVIIRQAAAAAIGENKIRQCIPNLRAALDDTGEVAFTAARALWDLGDRNGRQMLQDTYSSQAKNQPGKIESAMRDAKARFRNKPGLAIMGVNEASGALLGPFSMGITAFEDAMKDGGAPGRALAITLLAQECDPHSIELMEWGLVNDKNHLVQAATAKALGKCGDGDTVSKLMPLLVVNNDATRYMAAAAVVRLSIEKGAPKVVQQSSPAPVQ